MGLALVIVLAAAGLAWHECLLLVTAALAAQRLDLLRMKRTVPLDAWRFGTHCLVSGSAGLLASAALGMVLLASAVDWWQPSHNQPLLTVGMIAGVGVILSTRQHGTMQVFAEAGLWTLLVLGAMAGIVAAAAGASTWTCVISGAGVAYLAGTSWQLAVGGASLLRPH